MFIGSHFILGLLFSIRPLLRAKIGNVKYVLKVI